MASKAKKSEETKVEEQSYINAQDLITSVSKAIETMNANQAIAIEQFKNFAKTFTDYQESLKAVSKLEDDRAEKKVRDLMYQSNLNTLMREYIEARSQIGREDLDHPIRSIAIERRDYREGARTTMGPNELRNNLDEQIRQVIRDNYGELFSKDYVDNATKKTILDNYTDLLFTDLNTQGASARNKDYQRLYDTFFKAFKDGKLTDSQAEAAKLLQTQINKETDPAELAAYQKKLESDQAKRDTELSDKLGISKDKRLQFGNKFSFDKLMTITTGAGTAYESEINKNKKRISELNEKSALGLSSEESAELDFLNKDTAGLESKLAGAKSATTMIKAVQATVNTIKKGFRDINNIFKQTVGISFSIKDNFQDILKDVGSMLSTTSGVATYDTSTSYFTNSQARKQQIKYGLSSSSNWAFTQTSNLLGIRDDTDIAFMNDNQRTVFTEYMQKYTAMYNEMSANGTLTKIQEMQLELKSFKQEVAADLLSFVADNRDEILEAAQAIIGITKFIITAMTTIINWLPGLHTSSIDYLGYSSTASKANLSGLTLNTTVNVNGSADSTTLANDIAEASKSSLVQAMLGKNL